MDTITRNNVVKTPPKNLIETIEHYKAIKADHIPAGIVQTLNLAASKLDKSAKKSSLKTLTVPTADGIQIFQFYYLFPFRYHTKYRKIISCTIYK